MTFPRIADLIKPTKVGCAEVSHYTITDQDVLNEIARGGPSEKETIAVLRVNGQMMMSDNLHERLSNLEVIDEARGNTLIAGLGLGMVLHPILKNDHVTSVTVIEKEQDVITLVQPTLLPTTKLQIICDDIFTWEPQSDKHYDCIYFDIWADASDGVASSEQLQLESKFEKYKAEGGWIGSWHPFDTQIKKSYAYHDFLKNHDSNK
jgi:spermidine synthase